MKSIHAFHCSNYQTPANTLISSAWDDMTLGTVLFLSFLIGLPWSFKSFVIFFLFRGLCLALPVSPTLPPFLPSEGPSVPHWLMHMFHGSQQQNTSITSRDGARGSVSLSLLLMFCLLRQSLCLSHMHASVTAEHLQCHDGSVNHIPILPGREKDASFHAVFPLLLHVLRDFIHCFPPL